MELGGRDDRFTSEVPAALGLDLVLDVERSDARTSVGLDRTCDVGGTAEAAGGLESI